MTLAELSGAIASRDVSPVEVTQACLDSVSALDGQLHSFITVTADHAIRTARRAEAEVMEGHYRGPLHGVPIALKDIFATRGIRTTCGSGVLRDWVPDHDAEIVRRLDAAGAVLVGKLNMSEFAYGAIHPEFPAPRNPWNLDRFAGGSSSGSAAAVAAGLCYGSVGTDTGGSIRGPAAFCGIVGLKPTYGAVSRQGVVPLSWSLDHVGPMARTVDDAALLFDALVERVPAEPREVRSLHVGAILPDVQPDIKKRVRAALETLSSLVAGIVEVSLPDPEEAVAVWWTMCLAEAAAYHQHTLAKRPNDYGATVRERLQAGLMMPAVQYLQARRARRAIGRAFAALFEHVDVLVLPATLAEAPTIEAAVAGSWESMRERIRLMAPFNVAALPAISVPCGFTVTGLPVGLQVAGPLWADRTVLALARAYEQAAGQSRHLPPVRSPLL